MFGFMKPASPKPEDKPPPDPVKLNIVVQSAANAGKQIAELQGQLRYMEERLSREAQSWAQQRQELMKELREKGLPYVVFPFDGLWADVLPKLRSMAKDAPTKK